MGNIILTLINAFLFIFLISITNATAEQRMITFEMGESGQTVSFPMSQEEIDAANAKAVSSREPKKTGDTIRKRWVNRIELPESGQFVEFPMTDEEIQEAKKQTAQQNANINKRNSNTATVRDMKGEIIEMADGHAIVFYEDNTTKFVNYPVQ